MKPANLGPFRRLVGVGGPPVPMWHVISEVQAVIHPPWAVMSYDGTVFSWLVISTDRPSFGYYMYDSLTMAVPWVLSTETYSRAYSAIGIKSPFGHDLVLDPTGLRLFRAYGTYIYEYRLASPNNLSQLVSLNPVSYLPVFAYSIPYNGNFFVRRDGLMVLYNIPSIGVFRSTLGSPWNFSSITGTTVSSVKLPDAPRIAVSPDGTRLFSLRPGSNIAEYSMQSWDVSTLTLVGTHTTVSSLPQGIWINPEGTYLYVWVDISYQPSRLMQIKV